MGTNILIKWLKENIINEKGIFSERKVNKILSINENIKNLILEKTSFCPVGFPFSKRIQMILKNIMEFKQCKNCKIKNVSWNKQNGKILDYCSVKCASSDVLTREKVKKTNLKLFGVEQIMKSDKFKEIYKNTCIEKYGVENVSQVEDIKKQKKETSLKNWGVENVSQNEHIKEQKKITTFNHFGTEYPGQNEDIKHTIKQTNLNTYGTVCALQNEKIKIKTKKTNLEKFGNEIPMRTEGVKRKVINTKIEKYGKDFQNAVDEKRKITMQNRYGVEYPAQNIEFFNKQEINALRIFKYKDTNLTYQGSYERHFLEKMEKKGLLNEITRGKQFKYLFEDKIKTYHVDYYYKNINIEIKSTWTYNKNGKDKKLELKNKTKWKAVKNSNEKIVVLFNKKQIDNFVDKQIQPLKEPL